MLNFIKQGVVAELTPTDQNFAKLTWIPRKFERNLPVPSAEARRYANLSKRDPGTVMWWAHNGLQIHDNDWDLNMAYYSNQYVEPEQPVLAVVTAQINTSTVSVMTQTPAVMTDPVGVLPEIAYRGYNKLTTSWSSPYPGSTTRAPNKVNPKSPGVK